MINQTLNFITCTKRMQLFVAIFLVSFAKGQPTPFIPLTSYSVLIGNDVLIPCTVSANSAATLIQWQFTSNSGSSIPISQSTTKYTLVGDSTTTSNLTINSAALTDAGTYRCSATNSVGTGSDSATLTITGNAAAVTVSPPSQSVLQKSTAIIQCIINNANPGVTEVLWEKISSGTTSLVIVTGRFNGSTPSLPNLIISDLQPSDQGTYYCSARNAIGTSRSSTGSNLIVTGAVPNNVQIVGATTQLVNLGGSLTLQCAGQGDPAPTLSWIFSSSTSDATTVGTGTTYSITNAQRTNGGTYVCRGTNSLGSTDSQGVTVDVQYTPIDARTDAQKSISAAVGSTITLVCAVDANPVASYEWYRRNLLVSIKREYTFALSSLALLGSYTCKATNSRGSVELRYTLFEGQPTPFIPLTSYSVLIGNDVLIPCTVSANSAATLIQWQFTSNSGNSTPISQSTTKYTLVSDSTTTSNLTINSAALTDAGTYRCSATNIVGTGSDSATLTITGNVPAVSVSQTSYSIFVGSSVTLNCFVSGNPAVSFVFWTVTRNGSTQNAQDSRYSNGDINYPSLTINIARQSDTGVFVCKAQNSAGTTDSSPISLTVSGTSPNVTMAQSSYSVLTNGDVTLSCFVSANPSASISWTFTSNSGSVTAISASTSKYSLATSTTASSLTVRSANSNDQGSYRCSATNSVGTGQATAILVVSGSLPSINLPSTYSVITGNDITMTCSVSANPAVNSVFWQFRAANGFSFTNITATFKYSISSLTGTSSLTVRSTTSSDNGQYRCQATNQVGTSQSTTVLTVSGSIPVVSLPTTLYERTYGQNVTMQCSVTATPDITEVRWQRFVNGAYQDIFTQSSTKYYGSSITNFALTVTNLVFTDAGEYRCTATNQVGRGVSPNRATLSVLGGQPTPFIPLTSYSVLIGNDVQIPCTVSANPAATLIQWQFTSNSGSSTPISQSTTKYTLVGDGTTTSNLTINSAALTDAGTYRCSATNIVGTGSDSATLTITGNAATVTVSPPSQSVLQKSTAIIQCIINNANPGVTEVSWEKINSGTTSSVIVTGRFNGSTPSLPDLIISDLQPSDAGTYYCSARNAIGTSRSSTGSNLIVTGAVPNNVQILGATSQTVNLGGSLTLQCSGQGNPAPTLSWIFSSSTSDATEVGTGTTYSITNAQRTNGGTYVCRGTNSLGSTDSQGVTVDVQYAPIDARTDAQKSLTAAVGSTVSLVCAVDANPVASYEWYRNNRLVSNQRIYTFTLGSLELLGSYTCRATNSRGSVQLQYTLSQGNAGNTGASTATSGLSTGEIAAIILAVLLLLILIIIIIICCLTHGACGVICGKKQDVKGRVEPEKEVYKETQKEVIIPRFHEESIKGKRQPSAVSRKDVDIRVQNGGFRRENDYEIVRYETVPAAPPISTQYITESPRPHHLPALSYTYEDVEKKRKKRRKKKKHHHRRHHGEAEEVVVETVRSASPVRIIQEPVEEVVVERVIRSRSASPTRVIRTEAEEPTVVERVIRSSSPTRVYRQDIEEPVDYPPSPSRRRHGGYYDDERIIETRRSTRSPQRYRRESDEEMIIERRSPSTKRRYEENYITEERYSSGDVVQDDGDLRAYNGVVYREAPSRHSGGHYRVHGSERRSRSRSGRRERGSDDDLEVVYGKEYVVER